MHRYFCGLNYGYANFSFNECHYTFLKLSTNAVGNTVYMVSVFNAEAR